MTLFLYANLENNSNPEHNPAFAETLFSITPDVHLIHHEHLYLKMTPDIFKNFYTPTKLIKRFEELARATQTLYKNYVLTPHPYWAKCLTYQAQSIFLSEEQSKLAFHKLPIDTLVFCGNPLEQNKEDFLIKSKWIKIFQTLGISKISDFIQIPEQSLRKRFGDACAKWHRFSLNDFFFQLPIFKASEILKESIDTTETLHAESLLFLIKQKLHAIEARLQARHQGIHTLKISFHCQNSGTLEKYFKFSEATQNASTVFKTLFDTVYNIQLPGPLLSVTLTGTELASYHFGQHLLFSELEDPHIEIQNYITRMLSQNYQVGYFALEHHHLPECTWKYSTQKPTQLKKDLLLKKRPILFLKNPLPIQPNPRWRLEFSEEIQTNWWNKPERRRYFIAHLPNKKPTWIFYDGIKNQWFCHGTF